MLMGLWVSGWAQAGAVHWCPGNRFTDALTPAQAREQGCRPAASGRLSQVLPVAPPPGDEAAGPTATPAAASTSTSISTPTAPAVLVTPAASAPPPDAPRAVPATVQAARDRDARQILEAELQRTRVAQQALVSTAGGADPERLNRLRQDEAALRRELSRLGP